MRFNLVANRNGHCYYQAIDANGRQYYSVVPQGAPAPTCGCDNSYAACNGLYNIFRILK